MYIGDNLISSVKVGDTDVIKMYLGDIEVFQAYEKDQLENPMVHKYMTEVDYPSDDYSFTLIDNYLQATSYRKDQPFPVVVRSGGGATIQVSETLDWSNPLSYNVTKNNTELYNLKPSAKYYYRVLNSQQEVLSSGDFITKGQERMLKLDSLRNVRDIGGWDVDNGKRIKYGLIFRGSELDSYNATTQVRKRIVSDSDIAMMKDIIGIKAELDLREASVAANFSQLGEDVLYMNQEIGGYYQSGNSQARKCFRRLLDALRLNKPVYVHCAGGADRTGTLMFYLEALLGVSEGDLCKDYEMTSFSTYGRRARNFDSTHPSEYNFSGVVAYLKTLEGATLKEKAENWWKISNPSESGITESEIEEFRNYMIL